MSLKVIVLAIWAAVHPGAPRLPDAAPIAAAIETAVSQDVEPPVFGSREEDAAVMAYYAIRESWLTHDAIGDGGRSFGVWQLRSASGRALLHEGARICPASPAAPLSGGCVAARSTADRRATKARSLLESARKTLDHG
jgi:hypothetical protein